MMRRKTPRKTRNPKRNSCSRSQSDGSLKSYADVVRDYRDNYQHRAGRDLRLYAIQRTLSRVVELAGMAKTTDGKRQPHQRRLSASTLRRAHSELDQCDFNACRSFDELFQLVIDAMGSIHGIGELTVYDTARRIGAYLKLDPEKVYLHAGTRVGARAIGLGDRTDALEIDELPPAFRRLMAGEIEDCLCIYKDELKGIHRK